MAVTDTGPAPGPPRVFGLAVDPDELLPPDRFRFGDAGDPAARLLDLAHGLASSPLWAGMHAIRVVRTQPPAGLALIGRFTQAEVVRVEALPGQLALEMPRFRYVSYQQVEEDCARLGERLVERFGADEVRGFRYTGIPRGGLIVLGMLSYVLDLRRDRLDGSGADGERPVVLVDDCALTGYRFGELLRQRREPRVVFAHLYSHPELRSAIRTREPRVVDVLAAADLDDFAERQLKQEHVAWQKRWMERSGGRCYWIGRPEHLCFPWAEPDLTLWNPIAGREEPGWRVAPPRAALKNRFSGDADPRRVQVQPHSTGPVRVADRTFHGEIDGVAVAASLETGQVVTMDGVAAEIWSVLAGAGGVEDAVRELAERYDADPGTLRADAEQLVRSLTARGLLAVEPDAGADVRVAP